MKDGIGTIKIRAAEYFYLERWLRLDKDCESRPAKEQQIVLVNRDEINNIVKACKSK